MKREVNQIIAIPLVGVMLVLLVIFHLSFSSIDFILRPRL